MEGDNALNVQNSFFNQARKDRTRVTIFLTTGQRISGTVKSFDRFTLLMDTRHGDQIIFKHAIATVSTFRPSAGREADRREKGFGNFINFEEKKQ